MNGPAADTATTSDLAARLRARIAGTGPISFRDWMAAALYDERAGYYQRPDLARWGRTGDYRTSPERSPLFAATCAAYFATLYKQLGAPPDWTIYEAGAGAGHFAAGVLATLRADYPHVFQATRYVIDEASADARARCARRLHEYADRVAYRPLHEAPPQPGIVCANELLDALPVHRVRQRGGRLRELYVGLDAAGTFVWVEGEPSTPRLVEHFARLHVALAEGQTAEVNLDCERWLAHAAAALTHGFLCLFDYGAEAAELYGAAQRNAGTLRAFHRQQLTDELLAQPGAQDLTATVNWTQIKQVASAVGLRLVAHTRQDEFLLRAGLLDQLERAGRQQTSAAAHMALNLSARDMILPGGMSQSFQVLVCQK